MDCHYLLSLGRFLRKLTLPLIPKFLLVVFVGIVVIVLASSGLFWNNSHEALADSMVNESLCQLFGAIESNCFGS